MKYLWHRAIEKESGPAYGAADAMAMRRRE